MHFVFFAVLCEAASLLALVQPGNKLHVQIGLSRWQLQMLHCHPPTPFCSRPWNICTHTDTSICVCVCVCILFSFCINFRILGARSLIQEGDGLLRFLLRSISSSIIRSFLFQLHHFHMFAWLAHRSLRMIELQPIFTYTETLAERDGQRFGGKESEEQRTDNFLMFVLQFLKQKVAGKYWHKSCYLRLLQTHSEKWKIIAKS